MQIDTNKALQSVVLALGSAPTSVSEVHDNAAGFTLHTCGSWSAPAKDKRGHAFRSARATCGCPDPHATNYVSSPDYAAKCICRAG